MKVRIIALTKSLIEEIDMTAEELLVYEARVSNPSNQLNNETSDKLINFMIEKRHWSPFDMINMTIEITTSRAIAHQILRHWSIKPQEFSQRYAEATNYEPIQLRLAGSSNRQSSTKEVSIIDIEKDNVKMHESITGHEYNLHEDYAERALDVMKSVDSIYKEGIKLGYAKECIRMFLPLTTSTTMYLNGSVRSWIHYLEQRCDSHAQLEHQQSALLIKDIFKENFPNISKALKY